MLTEHRTHADSSEHPTNGPGRKVMGGMMGICLGGTLLAADSLVIPIVAALPLALAAGVAFAFASLRYHRFMGPMMAVCCGGAVMLAAIPGLGVALGTLVAV